MDDPGNERESDDLVSSESSGTLLSAQPHAMEGPQPPSAPSAPPFVVKLHELLSKAEFAEYIAWNAAGETLVIKDSIGLASHVLPVVWSHHNINSLFRQLNAYGFQRTVPPAMDGTIEFFHPDFQRGHFDRMLRIRLPRQKRSREESEPELTDQVQTLYSLHSRLSHLETVVTSELNLLNAKLDPLIAAWSAHLGALRPQGAAIGPNPCAACAVATSWPPLAESPLVVPPYGVRCQGMGLAGGLGLSSGCGLPGGLAGGLGLSSGCGLPGGLAGGLELSSGCGLPGGLAGSLAGGLAGGLADGLGSACGGVGGCLGGGSSAYACLAGAGASCRTDGLLRTTSPPEQQHALQPMRVAVAPGGEQGQGSSEGGQGSSEGSQGSGSGGCSGSGLEVAAPAFSAPQTARRRLE